MQSINDGGPTSGQCPEVAAKSIRIRAGGHSMAGNPVFTKLALAPASRQVSASVSDLISSGKLRPGDLLPTEMELALQLGVNRSTIREGLRALEHEGLVRRDGKRLRVAIPHYADLA